jgi:hypothetical protein
LLGHIILGTSAMIVARLGVSALRVQSAATIRRRDGDELIFKGGGSGPLVSDEVLFRRLDDRI